MNNAHAFLRPNLRQAKIVEWVNQRGEVSVGMLAQKFAASPETIRRDLTTLANADKLRKVHGGARPMNPENEGAFGARMRRNAAAKQMIAEKLAKRVRPGQTLFLDTGSTTLLCAEALANIKDLTIITNATRIAARFAAGSGGANIYLLGGRYRGDNAQTVGPTTIAEIANYNADIAILTIGAINATGAMDFSNQEAMVARAMLKSASQAFMLADHSKFEKRAAFMVCPLSKITTLISDRPPSAPLHKALTKHGVKLA